MMNAAPHDIGGRLRSAREQQGLTLRDVADRTKLQVHVLQAIERNDFSSLPAGMFRRAYVRMVAAEVGLDPASIAATYCAHFETGLEPAAPTRYVHGHDLIAELAPSSQRSLLSLAVLVTLAAGWFMLQSELALTPSSSTDADRGFVSMPVDDAHDAVSARPIDVVEPALAAASGRRSHVSIEINAAGWSWVAAETDGERVLYRLVEPGERVLLEGQQMIRLRVGDAGAVTLSINDGPRRALGGNGEVVDVEVTADSLDESGDVVVSGAAS